jgi:NAD+ kinase
MLPVDGLEPRFKRLAFLASTRPAPTEAMAQLVSLYGNVDPVDADVIIALGGDGFMLQVLHRFMDLGKPFFGMNRGTVGFLMNDYHDVDLCARLNVAEVSIIHPLLMAATDIHGRVQVACAINEVSLIRQGSQAARLRICVDGTERLAQLVADGVLVATPAGSTAYNSSVGGPILPLDTNLMPLTPISTFRPRRWHGAILPDLAHVSIDVLEADKRPVKATADHFEIMEVIHVAIQMDHSSQLVLLHDPGHSLSERILREQFGN